MRRSLSRILVVAAAAALVVPFAASCMDADDGDGRRAGDPGSLLEGPKPPEVEAQQLAATPKGKLLPLRDGEQRMTLDHAGVVHALRRRTATGTDDYRCFLLDPELDEDVWLTGSNVLPGNPNVVHHVILFKIPADAVGEAEAKDAGLRRPGLDLLRRHRAARRVRATSRTPTGWPPGRPAATRPRSRTGTASSSRPAPGS